MANMARREAPGAYQIGIYAVVRSGRLWRAHATGPGTIGTGYAGQWPTLAAAHLVLTGEPMREAGHKPPPGARSRPEPTRAAKRYAQEIAEHCCDTIERRELAELLAEAFEAGRAQRERH